MYLGIEKRRQVKNRGKNIGEQERERERKRNREREKEVVRKGWRKEKLTVGKK